MKCPCKGCDFPKRKLLCHSQCDEYKAWKEEQEERNRKQQADYECQFTNHPNKMTAIRKRMKGR